MAPIRWPFAKRSVPGSDNQNYFLPFAARWGSEHVRAGAPQLPFTLAKLRSGSRVGALTRRRQRSQLHSRRRRRPSAKTETIDAEGGRVVFSARPSWTNIAARGADPRHRRRAEQRVDHRRRAHHAENLPAGARRRSAGAGDRPLPHRGRAHYPNTPEFLGAVEYVAETGEHTALAIAFAFVQNQGDAWTAVVEGLDRALEDLALRQDEEASVESRSRKPLRFPARSCRAARHAHGRTSPGVRDRDRRRRLRGGTDHARRHRAMGADAARGVGSRARRARKDDRLSFGVGRPACRNIARCAAGAQRPHRCARRDGAAGREDAHSRRLSPRPSAGFQGRCDHHRFRGRAAPYACGTP